MGVFNNFIDYDAKEEAARRAENLRILEESSIKEQRWHSSQKPNMQVAAKQKPTAKIEKCSGAGSSYSVNCPSCGILKFLSSELNTMTAICNKCHCVFKLEK